MKLADLGAEFVHSGDGDCYSRVATLAEADGLCLDCPTCRETMLVWFDGAPPLLDGHRSKHTGNQADDLTLETPIACGCGWACSVVKGKVKAPP